MNTREKIVAIEHLPQLIKDGTWKAVAGLFDPLTAVEAARIETLGGGANVIAVVLDSPGALLPLEARVALMAGLRSVSLVVSGDSPEWRQGLGEVEVLQDAPGDQLRSQAFRDLVLERQNLAQGKS